MQPIVPGVEFSINSLYGKPNRSVLYTAIQCNGSEDNIIHCSSNELSYDKGHELIVEVDVAGVSCNPLTSISSSTTMQASTTMPANCPTTQCPQPTLSSETVTELCQTAQILQPTNNVSGQLGSTVQALYVYILAGVAATLVALSALCGIR